MECVILFRNTMNGLIGYVSAPGKDDDEIAVYPDRDAALDAADHVPILRVCPWQIIELDDL